MSGEGVKQHTSFGQIEVNGAEINVEVESYFADLL